MPICPSIYLSTCLPTYLSTYQSTSPAAFLVAFASHYGKVYVTAMRTTLEALIGSYNEMKASAWTWRRFHSQSSYMPFAPSLRSDIEFRIIGQYFIELNNLPVEFNFANYLNRLFLKYLAGEE